MDNRKDMIDSALSRIADFPLESSADGDNRSIFGLMRKLILSAPGESLADCRKPLDAVLDIKSRDPRARFHGCKLALLHQTTTTLFGSSPGLLPEKEFAGYDRDKLLEYLEICRRIFISKYAVKGETKLPPVVKEAKRNSVSKVGTTMSPMKKTFQDAGIEKWLEG